RTRKLRTPTTNRTESDCLGLSVTRTWALEMSSSVSRRPSAFGRVVVANAVRMRSIAGSFSPVGIGRNQNPNPGESLWNTMKLTNRLTTQLVLRLYHPNRMHPQVLQLNPLPAQLARTGKTQRSLRMFTL